MRNELGYVTSGNYSDTLAYDNTNSGLTSTNLQDAVDEIKADWGGTVKSITFGPALGGSTVTSSGTADLDVNALPISITPDNNDTIAIYDNSVGAMRKQTRGDFLGGTTTTLQASYDVSTTPQITGDFTVQGAIASTSLDSTVMNLRSTTADSDGKITFNTIDDVEEGSIDHVFGSMRLQNSGAGSIKLILDNGNGIDVGHNGGPLDIHPLLQPMNLGRPNAYERFDTAYLHELDVLNDGVIGGSLSVSGQNVGATLTNHTTGIADNAGEITTLKGKTVNITSATPGVTNFNGVVTCTDLPTAPTHLCNQQYVDRKVNKSGDTLTGIMVTNFPVISFHTANQPDELTNKQYVDNEIVGASDALQSQIDLVLDRTGNLSATGSGVSSFTGRVVASTEVVTPVVNATDTLLVNSTNVGVTLTNQSTYISDNAGEIATLNTKTQNMVNSGASTVFTDQLIVDGGTNPRIRANKITSVGGFTAVNITDSNLTIIPGQGNPTTVSTTGVTTLAVLLPGGDVQSQITSNDGEITSLNTKTQNMSAIQGKTTFTGFAEMPTLQTPNIRDETNNANIIMSSNSILMTADSGPAVSVNNTGLVVGSKNVGETIQNMTAISGVTSLSGVFTVPAYINTGSIYVNASIYTNTINPRTANPIAVNTDMEVSGVVKVDTIESLTTGPSGPLIQDDFSATPLKDGGQLVGFVSGYPFHNVPAATVQLTDDALSSQSGYLLYTDPSILSSINSAPEWYCRFTGGFTDSDGSDGQGLFVHWSTVTPTNNFLAPGPGYSFVYRSANGAIQLWYNGVLLNPATPVAIALVPGVDYLFEFRIAHNGTDSSTITMFLDGVLRATFVDEDYKGPFNMSYVGIGAYTQASTTFACDYYAKDIEIDTVPSGGGGSSVTVDSDLVVTDALTVGGVLQDTGRDVYAQQSHGVTELTTPFLSSAVAFYTLDGATLPGLSIANLLSTAGVTVTTAGAMGVTLADTGLYEINVNLSVSPINDDGTLVTLGVLQNGAKTDFGSVGMKLKTRYISQTVSCLIACNAGDTIAPYISLAGGSNDSLKIRYICFTVQRVHTAV
jgi:hypothetical protein